jgi:hypothetical protein
MTYICPMHPEVRKEGPGSCSICGMDLVPEDQVKKSTEKSSEDFWVTYRPLFIILGLIILPVALLSIRDFSEGTGAWWKTMEMFMAAFFLVFSGLKLLDLPGFAKGYSTYDLLAQRVYAYGYIYPFLELALGLMYLLGYEIDIANILTVILMAFSGIGVAIKLAKRERFQCACLGTMIKVPLTEITLIEDFGMAAMALIMIIF